MLPADTLRAERSAIVGVDVNPAVDAGTAVVAVTVKLLLL